MDCPDPSGTIESVLHLLFEAVGSIVIVVIDGVAVDSRRALMLRCSPATSFLGQAQSERMEWQGGVREFQLHDVEQLLRQSDMIIEDLS